MATVQKPVRFPSVCDGNHLGDNHCHCNFVAVVAFHGDFLDGIFASVREKDCVSCTRHFGFAAVGHLWCVGHVGDCAVDF